MYKTFLIIIALDIFFSLCESEYELIEQNIPFLVFSNIMNISTYKIYRYLPPCNGILNITKNVTMKIEFNDYFYIYLYSDSSKIEQDSDGNFINSDSNLYLNPNRKNNLIIYFSNLKCGKMYYFVFSYINIVKDLKLFSFKFLFEDENSEAIDISSLFLKSKHLKFYQAKNFMYSSNENKYILISTYDCYYNSSLTIFENNKRKIYRETEEINELFKFDSGQKYMINYKSKCSDSPIHFEIYNEANIFKHNFNDGPIFLNANKNNYYFEIDISKYKKGEYILFLLYNFNNKIYIKYQFKSNFNKNNNLIPLGEYFNDNYIPIKKTTEDSTLILFVKPFIANGFSLIDIYKYKTYEINSEFKDIIKGPCLYFLDYFKFNYLNSFGIQSNQKYILYEQTISKDIRTSLGKYENISIITNHYLNSTIYRKAFIFFNSTGDISFEIKKFNFPIIHQEKEGNYFPQKEYFQLCQGENTLTEIYFYLDGFNSVYNEVFIPVFGKFKSSFINIDEIQDLSDFIFYENKENFFLFNSKKKGFLKIQCEQPTMLHHYQIYLDIPKNLTSGQRFYFSGENIDKKFSFDKKLINITLPLKINTFGLDLNDKIIFKLNDEEYELNNTSLEINYTYNRYISDLIEFNVDAKIKGKIFIEMIIGFIEEDLSNYQQIDFDKALGTLEIGYKEEGAKIIKIPKDFNDDLYDYSIYLIQNGNYDAQIVYDNLIYAVPTLPKQKNLFPLIPLFKINPYLYISDNSNEDNNKFIYIILFNRNYRSRIVIKKPKLFSQFKLNQANIITELDEKDSKYYYQIEIPKSDDDYFYIQTSCYYSSISFSYSSIHYILSLDFRDNSNNNINDIPLNKNNIGFINLYETSSNYSFLITSSKEYLYRYEYNYIPLNLEMNQIENTFKMKIKMNSLSYNFYPNKYKYLLITNLDKYFDMNFIFQVLSGKEKLDNSKEKMVIIEDEGTKEIIEREIEIGKGLSETWFIFKHTMSIIPIIKEYNLIDFTFYRQDEFDWTTRQTVSIRSIVFDIIFSLALTLFVVIGLCIVILYLYRRTRRKKVYSIDNNLDLNINMT